MTGLELYRTKSTSAGEARYPVHPILAVDDDAQALEIVRLTLRAGGFNNVISCSDPTQVRSILDEHSVSLILLDVMMPHISGDQLLPALREAVPQVPVIMITGQNDLDLAVRCMRLGAHDYLLQPFEPRRLMTSVRRALELSELQEEYKEFVSKAIFDEIKDPEAFSDIIADCPSMRAIFHYVETIAASHKPVLITGESGVGKELIARAVHRVSRGDHPFVSETVAGYDDTMFSDAVFGHVAGAYTSASGSRSGLVESAGAGTLFLDEIGELSLASQVKLLRLVQEREYRHLGSDDVHHTSARFVFATNRDLLALQQSGDFRRDLFYRISIHHIDVPPLRSRRSDIAPLVRHFVDLAAKELGKEVPTIPNALFQLLHSYSFPGNVRELEYMVFDAVAHATDRRLSLHPFLNHINRQTGADVSAPEDVRRDGNDIFSSLELLPTLDEVHEWLIEEAMKRAAGNQGVAARLLGISRTALNKRLRSA